MSLTVPPYSSPDEKDERAKHLSPRRHPHCVSNQFALLVRSFIVLSSEHPGPEKCQSLKLHEGYVPTRKTDSTQIFNEEGNQNSRTVD